jgi:hypothetical protein
LNVAVSVGRVNEKRPRRGPLPIGVFLFGRIKFMAIQKGKTWLTVLAAGVLLLTGPVEAFSTPVSDKARGDSPEAAKAEQAVKDYLEMVKGANAAVGLIQDEAVGKVFPKQRFVSALFRQFPVARIPPAGLRSSNVFVVTPGEKLRPLPDVMTLEEFARATLGPVKEDDVAKDVARAWIRLAQEFHQDGFYQFALMDDSTKIIPSKGGKTVTAKVVVMKGGNGTITATLEFDAAGKLAKVTMESKLKPGPRPICQATKLLDGDPLVRRMAEQDLLYMGRCARAYLLEQRALASPALQQAIDQMWRRILAEDEEKP